MRSGAIAFVAAVLLLPCSAFASSRTAMSPAETALLRAINGARANAGLAPLRPDAHLEAAARSHSREMLATNTFAHGAFASRMVQFDVRGVAAGENLAWGSGYRASAQAIVAAWLTSPEHRANLLRASFTRVGVGALAGAFQGAREARVVTADFAG